MTKKFAQLIFLLLSFQLSFAQSIKIDLLERVEDDKFAKSKAILPIYEYENDTIERYTLFGVELSNDESPLIIRKKPNLADCKEIGYTYLYFGGADNGINKGYILTLLCNYKTYRTNLFFIDRNNNLDFTDDGPPDTLKRHQSEMKVVLENPSVSGAHYEILLKRFDITKNARYLYMVKDHYEKNSGQKKFTHIQYCFNEKRYNVLAGHYKNGNDSFTFAIKDMNVNGIFSENCIDQFYIGSYKGQVNTLELKEIKPRVSQSVFEWNGKKYFIKAIEKTGKFVEIEELKNSKLEKTLKIGKKIPKFSYQNIKHEKVKIKRHKKKPFFLILWDEENLNQEDIEYLNKIHNELSDKIDIIALNHGDYERDVRLFIYYDNIKWPVGFSSYELGKKLKLEDLPKGLHIGKKLKLLEDNISPKELYNKLK